MPTLYRFTPGFTKVNENVTKKIYRRHVTFDTFRKHIMYVDLPLFAQCQQIFYLDDRCRNRGNLQVVLIDKRNRYKHALSNSTGKPRFLFNS